MGSEPRAALEGFRAIQALSVFARGPVEFIPLREKLVRSGETYGNTTRLAPRMTRVSEVLEKIGSPAARMISS